MKVIPERPIEFVQTGSVVVLDRARKEFSSEGLAKLTDAICTNIGLLHPIIILQDNKLLTGERRLKVISTLHETGRNVQFVGKPIPNGTIPAIRVTSEFDALDLLIAEDVENSARESFTWQEQATIVANIARLQQLKINAAKQKEKEEQKAVLDLADDDIESEDAPSKAKPAALASLMNLMANPEKIKITTAAAKAASQEIHGRQDAGYYQRVQTSIKLDEALQDPELAKKLNKAPTQKEAQKILMREEKRVLQSRLAHAQGSDLRVDRHIAINGDCLEEMAKLESESVNVCLVDPIYGINSHKFGVAKRDVGVHKYDDSPEEFERLLPLCIKEVSRILKKEAHIYMFCDHTKFSQLKGWLEQYGSKHNTWNVQSFPLHYIKVNGSRCPIPGYTWRKTVEYIIFAWRGGKQSHHQYDSHFEVSTKRTEINGAAKEPEALKILLNNSCYPGDTVIDFMAGSGATAVACEELKLKSISIEKDKSDYGRIVERIKSFRR